jgi:hypothetical protein
MMGALVGALLGVGASYVFFTSGGRSLRERLEPALDELGHEWTRFQRTIEKVGEMANEGIRVVQEFKHARAQSQYPPDGTSH